MSAETERQRRFLQLFGRNTWSQSQDHYPGVYYARITCIRHMETSFQHFFIRACWGRGSGADITESGR